MNVAANFSTTTSQHLVNNQTEPNDGFVYRNSVWLVEFITAAVVLVISLFLITSMTYHWLKCSSQNAGKSRRSRESQLSNTTKKICVAIAVMTFLYQFFSLGFLLLERHVIDEKLVTFSESLTLLCRILPRSRVSVLIIAAGLSYLFLWERQRVFYINPSLKMLNSKVVRLTSYFVLSLWIIYFIPIIILYCVLVSYELQYPTACRANSLPRYRSIIISWHCVGVFMQIALLGLFINPMLNRLVILNQSKRKKQGSTKKTSVTRLLARVKRAVILTSVCLISDILSAILVIVLFRPNTNNFSFPYNINLMVNLFAVIGCFDNWKLIVCPWTQKDWDSKRSYPPKSTSVTSPANNSASIPSFVPVAYSVSTPSKQQSVRKKEKTFSIFPSRCVAFSDSDV